MQKVTPESETRDTELFDQLGRAVRILYGAPDGDLQQEAFLRTLQALRRTRVVRHPRAFVWKIVRDTVADHWRRQLRDNWEDVTSIPDRFVATAPDFDGDLDRQRRLSQLKEAILDLGSGIRGPVYLYYIEGYSMETITRIYKKSPSAVKMALYRGRRHLLRMIRSGATKKSRS